MRQFFIVVALTVFCSGSVVAQEQGGELEAVQLYSDADLVDMFANNTHLNRVEKQDRCQLVQDIEAQADIEQRPTYQFLYGDMLAWGICYEQDEALGILYMEKAAQQGLIAALEQLGRYYHQGTLVQKDVDRAILYLREAASLGNIPAQLRLADILIAGQGSPYDFKNAYRWLHHAVTANESTHQAITKRMSQLEQLMPPSVVEDAKSPLN
ncbi:tetratricopeptide repeat protein [Idiomarina sp. MD25a]|uniref:tetratricopeptide repeat protein n=1 Tax=Idiomarina sp. MD25a TaxID=1889913 RepID=UPI0009F624A2|nr:tetratricopeptide repeat protein [Idiomarina sp. MD25a]